MSTTKAEKKELELRQARAEAEKAEIELRETRRRDKRYKRDHELKHKGDRDARGVFHFRAQVDADSVAYYGDKILRFAHLNPGASITLYLTTPGGSAFDCFAFFDTLRTLSGQGHHITTVVRGMAASAGAILLQAGDTRLVGAESHVMIHELAAGAFGKLHEMEDEVKFMKRWNRRIFSVIANRTDGKWDADKLYKWAKAKDRWLAAEEAVEHGFADAVG